MDKVEMVFYTSTSTDEICDYVMHGHIQTFRLQDK